MTQITGANFIQQLTNVVAGQSAPQQGTKAKKTEKSEKVDAPKIADSDEVEEDGTKKAKNLVDDGKFTNEQPPPDANPELDNDLKNQMNQASINPHGAKPRLDASGSGVRPGANSWHVQGAHLNGMSTSGQATVAAKRLGSVRADLIDPLKGETNLANGAINAKGEVHVGMARANARAATGFDLKKGAASAEISARAEAHAVGAEGGLKSKIYGNSVVSGQTSVLGKAYVGAEAGGFASVSLNPKDGTLKAGAAVEAFAGAKASAVVKQSVGVGGTHVGTVAARGEVYAGIGIKASASVGIEDGKVSANIELGAALGIGAGANINLEVDVAGVAKGVVKGAKSAARAVGNAAGAVSDVANQAWSGVKSLFW